MWLRWFNLKFKKRRLGKKTYKHNLPLYPMRVHESTTTHACCFDAGADFVAWTRVSYGFWTIRLSNKWQNFCIWFQQCEKKKTHFSRNSSAYCSSEDFSVNCSLERRVRANWFQPVQREVDSPAAQQDEKYIRVSSLRNSPPHWCSAGSFIEKYMSNISFISNSEEEKPLGSCWPLGRVSQIKFNLKLK